jgi:hypothetical protein
MNQSYRLPHLLLYLYHDDLRLHHQRQLAALVAFVALVAL